MNWYYTQQHQLIDLSVMEFFGVSRKEDKEEIWLTCQKDINQLNCIIIGRYSFDEEESALKELEKIHKILQDGIW